MAKCQNIRGLFCAFFRGLIWRLWLSLSRFIYGVVWGFLCLSAPRLRLLPCCDPLRVLCLSWALCVALTVCGTICFALALPVALAAAVVGESE